MTPLSLRVEHLTSPLGLDIPTPRFSWKLKGSGRSAVQTAYRLIVAFSSAKARSGHEGIWDTGKVLSANSHLVSYKGPELRSHTRYWWTVQVWDGDRKAGRASAPAWFETGFLGHSWPSVWIEAAEPRKSQPNPAWLLRRSFSLAEPPKSARLYITARGWFEPWINGKRIGQDHLAPGWTDYNKRIEYSTYDVTGRIQPGENTLGSWLADGWACSWLMGSKKGYYGDKPSLLAALRIKHRDGRIEWIASDRKWQCRRSPITSAGLYEGEVYDARREVTDWSGPESGSNRGWKPVAPTPHPPDINLTAKALPPVRTVEEFPPRKLTQPRPGLWVFDLGQNIAGVARLRIRQPRGTRLTLRHAEMLQADGSIYTENLRGAPATDTYTCRGTGTEEWQPKFTFHGFRYVELTGLKGRPAKSTLTGLAWSSDLEPAGDFSCSHPLINQLQSNIQWGQRGNFLDVPTDCPQRDERLGWSADAQVFTPTALFNFDSTAFLRKYCHDLRDGQSAEGAFPDVAPDVLSKSGLRPEPEWSWLGNAAWADAGVIIPWVIYERSGDLGILRENYDAMLRWIDYQERTSSNLIRPDTNYGDWVATEAVRSNWAPTPCDMLGTAHFAHSTNLTARCADLLGQEKDAARLRRLHARIVKAFNHQYVAPSGRLSGDTQTGYCMALAFNLLPEKLRPAAISHLKRAIEKRGWHLSTGFIGTPFLCPVLTRHGAHDIACRLLLNENYPSWLMPVKNGATTMWERWNSWTPEDGFGPVDMNSFNHYAFGAVGDWLYRKVAGLGYASPGYKRLHFQPRPGGGLTRASAWHETPYGRAESAWRISGSKLVCRFVVPANTAALAILPARTRKSIEATGPTRITLRRHQDGFSSELNPGHWRFVISQPVLTPVHD
ncbi:MAG: alpha-L-rhamnosidase [Verrucomicrobia bacterium]|nr:MAG: alpha-L-rhamnosidase [Verrucomicrobiota bacterium]